MTTFYTRMGYDDSICFANETDVLVPIIIWSKIISLLVDVLTNFQFAIYHNCKQIVI